MSLLQDESPVHAAAPRVAPGPARYTHQRDGIVHVSPPTELTDPIIEEFLAELNRRRQGGQPYALLFDMREAGIPTASQRQRLAQHMKNNERSIQDTIRGMALVATNPVLRGVVTAVCWLARPSIPYRVVADEDEGVRWLQEQLARSV